MAPIIAISPDLISKWPFCVDVGNICVKVFPFGSSLYPWGHFKLDSRFLCFGFLVFLPFFIIISIIRFSLWFASLGNVGSVWLTKNVSGIVDQLWSNHLCPLCFFLSNCCCCLLACLLSPSFLELIQFVSFHNWPLPISRSHTHTHTDHFMLYPTLLLFH